MNDGTHPSLKSEVSGKQRLYKMAGDWTADFAEECLRLSENIAPRSGATVKLVCGGLQKIDITGAWIVHRRLQKLRQQGSKIDLEGFKAAHTEFMRQVAATPLPDLKSSHSSLKTISLDIETLGRRLQKHVADILAFVGWCLVLMARTILQPSRFRWRAFVKQCEVAAIRATPIVCITTFLIAIVLTYQGSSQLRRFGAEIFTIDLVVISILREMGVLLTAIMIAGRSGSAFAAEIGAMKLNEELDALKTTGLEPMEILVLPRLLALTIMLPLLTFVANMAGFLGAGLLTTLNTHTSWLLFNARLSEALTMKDFWIGIGKAPVFGFAIAMIGCYHGMAVSTSAESVGRETTNAVVNAIFAVMLADALFSIIFTTLGL